MKDLTTRYANDVIASCAFGLKVNSHMEKNNQFYEMGKSTLSLNIRQKLVVLVLLLCPKIAKVSTFKVISRRFFSDVFSDNVEQFMDCVSIILFLSLYLVINILLYILLHTNT